MKLPFWEEAKPPGAILGTALENVIQELCDRKQTVLVATPYLHYESRFLDREGQALVLRASMSREAVRHALGHHPLRLRFPWALSFYSGPTHILGYEQTDDRRCLKVAVPDHLVLDEQRRAFRVDRVGHSSGAIGDEDGTILRVRLENISTLGAAVFCLEPLRAGSFRTGRQVDLSLSLEQGVPLMASARICHSQGQSLGLAFHPPLGGSELQQLSDWLAPREKEALHRWENRAELRAKAELLARPKAAPSGVLLLSSDAALGAEVAAALEDLQPVRTIPPAMAPLKEALVDPPRLLLIDAADHDLEDRRRLRTMLETAQLAAPILVLGRSANAQPALLLASELQALGWLEWSPRQRSYFRGLVQDSIRRHWGADLPQAL